jgi:flagellar hook-associated protein 2
VFVGSSTAQQPLLITSSTNQISNVIQGVTLDLNGTSASPVELNVTQDTSGLTTSLQNFVTTFNALTTSINSQTTYDTSTNTAGLLLGDPVASSITSALFTSINASLDTGTYRSLSQLGITVGSNGQLSFDQDTFNQAIATDPTGVENLFNASTTTNTSNGSTSTVTTGLAYVIGNALNTLIDPVAGTVNAAENELSQESLGFSNQITQLNTLLAQKQAQLQAEFANMESVLANLQSQQSSLSSIGSVSTSSSSTSKTSTA